MEAKPVSDRKIITT